MKKLIILLILLFLLPGMAYCREKLVIISPHWEGVKIEISRAFKKHYSEKFGKEIELEWIDQGGTSDDLRFVESLFKKNPEGIDIDLFFGGGMDPYLRLKSKNLLRRYQVDANILKEIPETCAGIPNYGKDYYWYGVVLSSFGILYNKRALDYLNLSFPETWEELGKGCYYSWAGAADPRHSGSMHMMYEIILQRYGWEKGWEVIFSLAGNTKHFSSSASNVAKDTSIGEVALSLCIDSYALAQIQVNGEENMGFILPEGSTVINPDAIGILKGAPDLSNAQKFIDFLLSYDGQLIWMLSKGKEHGPREFCLNRLSIRKDVYNHPDILFKKMNPYNYTGSFPYDFKLASKRWAFLNDAIGSCVIDCHGELTKAWKKMLAFESKHAKGEFYSLPFKERMQDTLCKNWADPVYRNSHITEWLNFSREKFAKVARQLKNQRKGNE